MKYTLPRNYNTASELSKEVSSYFELIHQTNDYATITGLCIFCGIPSKQHLLQLRNRPNFADIIDFSLTLIENEHEKQLYNDKCSGAIFALKNMGWLDRQDINHNVNSEKTEEELQDRLNELNRLKKLTHK